MATLSSRTLNKPGIALYLHQIIGYLPIYSAHRRYNLLLFPGLRHGGAEGTTIHHLIKQSNQLLEPGQIGICHSAFTFIHQVRDIDLLSQQVFDPLIFLRDLKQ